MFIIQIYHSKYLNETCILEDQLEYIKLLPTKDNSCCIMYKVVPIKKSGSLFCFYICAKTVLL